MPDLGVLVRTKRWLDRQRLRYLHGVRNVPATTTCGVGIRVSRGIRVRIESDSYIGNAVHFGCPVNIGPDVMIASNVAFVGGDHIIPDGLSTIRSQGPGIRKRIVLVGDNWIGHGAILLHGIQIGLGAVVGAGSVVTRDVSPFDIVAGNPARKIGERYIAKQEVTTRLSEKPYH